MCRPPTPTQHGKPSRPTALVVCRCRPRPYENALGFDGHPVRIREMTDRVCLSTVMMINPGRRVQPSESCRLQIAEGDGARERRLTGAMCRRAEHVIQDQRAHASVYASGRTFVGCAEVDIATR